MTTNTKPADRILAAHPVPGTDGYEILLGQFAKSGAYFVARHGRRNGLGYVILSRHTTEAAARTAANAEWTADRDAMRRAS